MFGARGSGDVDRRELRLTVGVIQRGAGGVLRGAEFGPGGRELAVVASGDHRPEDDKQEERGA